jgi:hypothetical protein
MEHEAVIKVLLAEQGSIGWVTSSEKLFSVSNSLVEASIMP